MIKTMLFIMTILRLGDDSIVKQVFIERTKCYNNRLLMTADNIHCSPTFEMLEIASRLGMFNVVCEMVSGRQPLIPKKICSACVWEKAWLIEDMFWSSTATCILHKDNDL